MNRTDAENADPKGYSILSPQNWPFSLECLPPPVYLVGGAVRDALLDRRKEYLDLDFVLPTDAVKTARQIASHYQAGFVLLDPDRQIARVVFKNATADFAQQEGDALETDLQRRDFTVNAIAYNPHTRSWIDPLQGRADLQAGLLRMVKASNLEDDPLRLLRAYRQAAQLDLAIEPQTQAAIRQLSSLLGSVAAERVQVEINYLLNCPQGTPWLTAAITDGLLSDWFDRPDRLSAIDRAAILLAETWPSLGIELAGNLGGNLKISLLGVAKLASLLRPPLERAEEWLWRLKYSRAEVKAVTTALKSICSISSESLTIREQFFLFRQAGEVFPAVAVLAIANGMDIEEIAPLINRYLDLSDRVAHPVPIVTGDDLMKAFNLPPGRKVGQLLIDLQLAQAEGQISTLAEALAYVDRILDRLSD
jgi:tRNA nucleotidyltransferase (CCA-adding enzyme)